MNKLISVLLVAVLAVGLTSCSLKQQEIYYDYDDLSDFITVGEYSTSVDKSSDDYDEFYHSYYNDTFGDTLSQEVNTGTVEKWDKLNINYVCYHDGKEVEGGVEMGCELTVGSGDFMIDGFEDGLIGAPIGQTTQLELTLPDDYYVTDVAGENVIFHVLINSAVKFSEPGEDDVAEAGFTSVAEYERAAEKYAVSLYLYYAVYDATVFNSYPEKETQVLLDSVLSVVRKECDEQGITLEQKAGSYGWTLDEYKQKLVDGIQNSYTNMPRDLVSHYVLQTCDKRLNDKDIDKTRNEIIREIDSSLEEAGYSEIEIQRRAAYEKALDVLYEQYGVD